jgi:hypothetical protein
MTSPATGALLAVGQEVAGPAPRRRRAGGADLSSLWRLAAPNVLWFDEPTDEARFHCDSSLSATTETAVLVVVGATTALALPTKMCSSAVARGVPLVVIDPEPSALSAMAASVESGISMQGPAAGLVPDLCATSPARWGERSDLARPIGRRQLTDVASRGKVTQLGTRTAHREVPPMRRVWFWSLLLGLGCAGPPITSTNGPSPDGDAWDPHVEGRPPLALPPATDARPPDVTSSCQRTLNFKAVTISRPVPFDVVIVADNSDSVSWSRDKLSAGLENLLARVHGHEARFFVLTTTQYGASSEAAYSLFRREELVKWRDPVTGAAHAHPMTEYRQSCVDDKGAAIPCPATPLAAQDAGPFTLTGTWEFQMPPPIAAITPSMTAAELASQQKKIADAVLALGGGGAQQEQPICTLGRYLAQRPEALPKHVVFLVLSDEDDVSTPDACLASYQAKKLPSPFPMKEPCTSGCTSYTFGTSRPRIEEHIRFRCVPVDDTGTEHPERARDGDIDTNRRDLCTPASRDCNMAELARATTSCGPGQLVKDCKLVCGSVHGSVYCQLNRPSDATDLCTQAFDEGGKRYANLADYCAQSYGGSWGTCSKSGWKETGKPALTSMETVTPVVEAGSLGEMVGAVKASAQRLFGPRNYSIESIVLDPAFTCALGPGQSYAPTLRGLASSAQDVFPLCQDYAPALQRIETFASFLVQSDFTLDLDAYEDVDSVVVTTKSGATRTVKKPDFRYDRMAHLLRFNPGVLGPQDEGLAVTVARYCEVVK